MLDTLLEKEKAELLRDAAIKEKEERMEENRIERERRRDLKKKEKEEKKKKKRRRSSSRSSSEEGNKTPDYAKKSILWKLEVHKNGTVISSIPLKEGITCNLGRSETADVRFDHGSCSKNHAKISFISGVLSIMDLSSTNGTNLNGKDLAPGNWNTLKRGDKLKFGCSTREYVVQLVE
jgi:hypothetical protein